ncbi:MAG: histone deacetylase family protein [Thermomicrobiales bacterium]
MNEPHHGDRRRRRNRTALFRSPKFLRHDTGNHPENPGRIAAIDAELHRRGLLDGRPEIAWGPAGVDQLERVHDPRYVEAIRRLARDGGAWLDADTLCGPDSVDVAMLGAGAAVAAVDAAMDATARRGFTLGRPPGHHATAVRGMGFCLLNSVAVAAAHALSRGARRVAIVDWDVHHGNGTQDIFSRRADVLVCSVHQYGGHFYPGTGGAEETGDGPGRGFTINAPLAPGQNDRVYACVFDELFLPALRTFDAEVILISAGFDAHADDPIANMNLTEAGFAGLARRLVDLSEQTAADGRLVAVLEGGYDPAALAGCVCAVLDVLDGGSGRADDVGDARPRV